MNAATHSDVLVFNEPEIRQIALSISNALKLAQAQQFPFAKVKYPKISDVYTILAKKLGFNTHKGLIEALENNLTVQISGDKLGDFNCTQKLKALNGYASDIDIAKTNVVINSIFNQVISGLPLHYQPILTHLKRLEMNSDYLGILRVNQGITYVSKDYVGDLIFMGLCIHSVFHSNPYTSSGFKDMSFTPYYMEQCVKLGAEKPVQPLSLSLKKFIDERDNISANINQCLNISVSKAKHYNSKKSLEQIYTSNNNQKSTTLHLINAFVSNNQLIRSMHGIRDSSEFMDAKKNITKIYNEVLFELSGCKEQFGIELDHLDLFNCYEFEEYYYPKILNHYLKQIHSYSHAYWLLQTMVMDKIHSIEITSREIALLHAYKVKIAQTFKHHQPMVNSPAYALPKPIYELIDL